MIPLSPEWLSSDLCLPTGWSRAFKSLRVQAPVSVAGAGLSEPLQAAEPGSELQAARLALRPSPPSSPEQEEGSQPCPPARLTMGEDAAHSDKSQGSELRPEKPASPSPAPSSTPSPSLHLGSADEAARDQVNAVTVLTLLDKLVKMMDVVQENQHKMEQRQISLEGSVKGIQNDLTKLSKYQASTGSTVSKLLDKSRKVSAHTRAVRERLERQCAQVKRLESNHAQLLRRNHFKVLIFQVSAHLPPPTFLPAAAAAAAHIPELNGPGSRHLSICPSVLPGRAQTHRHCPCPPSAGRGEICAHR